LGLEFWVVLLVILSLASYRSLRRAFNFQANLKAFFYLNVVYELLVLTLLGFFLHEIYLYRSGVVSSSSFLFLVFLLVFTHFIPRILCFSTLTLESYEGEGDNEHRDKLREGVLDFAGGVVREAMVPLNDVFQVPRDLTLEEFLQHEDFRPYSRIPVYQGESENVIGLLYAKDLIQNFRDSDLKSEDFSLIQYIRPAYYVPEMMEQTALLQEFRRRRIQMAIVVDEYGITTGLVTLEDLMETIVGELQDKKNDDDEFVHHSSAREWVLDAMIDLDDFSDLVGLEIESDSVETLGGYVFESLGRLPEVGEILKQESLEFKVLEMEKYRLRRIAVRRSRA